jgi:hypothetical protein
VAKGKPFGGKQAPPFGGGGKTGAERKLEAKRGSGPKSAAEIRMERKRGVNPKKGD